MARSLDKLGTNGGVGALAVCGVLGWSASAGATWSVAAVDPETREVGVAGATCNDNVHERIPGLVPDVGALASQAASFDPNRQLALQLMQGGSTPDEILTMVAAQDSQWETRQMGIADLTLASAAHTGASNQPWAGDMQAPGVSVQGNILRAPEVVSDPLAIMIQDEPSCPYTLADRLMEAMEAGRDQGGDMRCPIDAPAQSAFLLVARPGDDASSPTVEIIVGDSAPNEDPIALLRTQYDEWRAANPPSDEDCGGTGTGSSSSGSTDDGGDETTTSGSTTSGGSTTSVGGSTGAADGSGDDSSSGCSCKMPADGVPLGLLALLVFVRPRPGRGA